MCVRQILKWNSSQHDAHKIHFCYTTTLKFQEIQKKNSFAATETDDVFSCLLFLDNSPPASFCVCSGSAMDPFVCCVKEQRDLILAEFLEFLPAPDQSQG